MFGHSPRLIDGEINLPRNNKNLLSSYHVSCVYGCVYELLTLLILNFSDNGTTWNICITLRSTSENIQDDEVIVKREFSNFSVMK